MNPEWMEGLKVQCKARGEEDKTGTAWSLFLLPEAVPAAAKRLYKAGFFLEDIAGMDSAEGLTVAYHFDRFTRPGRVALYVTIPQDHPEIPSISHIFSGAAWHERECHDFFGICFIGNPDLSPILVPDDLEGYPLIKEEGQRISLENLLVPGQILDRDSRFTLFQQETVKNQDRGNAFHGPQMDESDQS